MTVRELIELLQRFPPDAPVYARMDDVADEIGKAEMQTKTWASLPILMLESL